MHVVTVFRHTPAPIIGTVGVIHDRASESFEAALDWLETTGMLVERFHPATAVGALARHPAAAELFERVADECLPLVLLDEVVASQGRLLSRTELARAIGEARRARRRGMPVSPTRSAA
jgi:hypothetical protein